MENNKQDKLYGMLKSMSDYSIEQPKVIEDLCNQAFISPAYAPAINLIVEAFLSVHSFALLMFEGLISNASAILRILIEQVATITVICKDHKAMYEFLRFQKKKTKYYSLNNDERKSFKTKLIEETGKNFKQESAIKEYLDYGWIRAIRSDKDERGKRLILKEANLEELISDISEQLNAFAHGQRSIFNFINDKNLTDRHVSRIIMISGKLFLLLCYSKHKLLVNESRTHDKFFRMYLNAKILFCDLNARSMNNRIIDIIKTTDNLDRDILYLANTLDNMRGMIYQSELNFAQGNIVARAYVLNLMNFMFMICYKLYCPNDSVLERIISFDNLIETYKNKLNQVYESIQHSIPFNNLFEMAIAINDKWGLIKKNGSFDELGEIFLTDFTSFVHALFNLAYPTYDEKILEEYLLY